MLACLILDLHIPDMDALSLQRRLADDGCQIPIILLTAHGDSETRAQAVNEGAVAFLTKPSDGALPLAAATSAVARIHYLPPGFSAWHRSGAHGEGKARV